MQGGVQLFFEVLDSPGLVGHAFLELALVGQLVFQLLDFLALGKDLTVLILDAPGVLL